MSGHGELRPRLDEGVQSARHHGAGAGAEEVGAQHADRHAVEAHVVAEDAGSLCRAKKMIDGEMILQVLADRQIDDRVRCRSARRWSAGPMPDSISSCGELNAPPDRITSRSASACTIVAGRLDVLDAAWRACLHDARASRARRFRPCRFGALFAPGAGRRWRSDERRPLRIVYWPRPKPSCCAPL